MAAAALAQAAPQIAQVAQTGLEQGGMTTRALIGEVGSTVRSLIPQDDTTNYSQIKLTGNVQAPILNQQLNQSNSNNVASTTLGQINSRGSVVGGYFDYSRRREEIRSQLIQRALLPTGIQTQYTPLFNDTLTNLSASSYSDVAGSGLPAGFFQ